MKSIQAELPTREVLLVREITILIASNQQNFSNSLNDSKNSNVTHNLS